MSSWANHGLLNPAWALPSESISIDSETPCMKIWAGKAAYVTVNKAQLPLLPFSTFSHEVPLTSYPCLFGLGPKVFVPVKVFLVCEC